MDLALRLHRAGETSWRPPEPPTPAKVKTPASPVMLTFAELVSRLGWCPETCRRPDVSEKIAALLPETITYYADLGPGAAVRYTIGTGPHEFGVIQRKVLAVHSDFHFVYPAGVATTTSLAGGTAVFVLPPPERGMSFAIWVGGEDLFDITYNWPIDLAEAQLLLTSVLPPA